LADQPDASEPARPVERRSAVLAAGVDRPAEVEHPLHHREFAVARGIRHAAPILVGQPLDHVAIARQDRPDGLVVPDLAGLAGLRSIRNRNTSGCSNIRATAWGVLWCPSVQM